MDLTLSDVVGYWSNSGWEEGRGRGIRDVEDFGFSSTVPCLRGGVVDLMTYVSSFFGGFSASTISLTSSIYYFGFVDWGSRVSGIEDLLKRLFLREL